MRGLSRSGHRPSESRFGFTLLELLVVMSVVSLLTALLLPALHRAREQSRDIKCRSNLRQVAFGVAGYSVDWFDVVPREGIAPWYDRLSGYEYIPWIEAVRRYLVNGPPDQLASPVYLDPAHPNPNHQVHYVINGIHIPVDAGGYQLDRADRRPAGPVARVRFPDRMMYLTEFTDDRDNSIAKSVQSWNLKQSAGVYDVWNQHHLLGKDVESDPLAIYVRRVGPFRHGPRNNVLFIDAHVDSAPGDSLFDASKWADGY